MKYREHSDGRPATVAHMQTLDPDDAPAPDDSMFDTPAGPHVLMVEDDGLAADMLRFILEREGYTVTHAVDGRLARQIIDAEAPPALALLDIDLPYHDGFELIEAIRGSAAWAEVPILMLSSKGTELDIARALDAGADDFIVKPFQLEELKARVRRRIRKSR